MALKIMYEALELDSINADILHRLVALLMDNNDHQNAILYNQKFVDHRKLMILIVQNARLQQCIKGLYQLDY